ncbi:MULTISPECIES: SpoIIE family protein phosphatase [unclassified Streptomyces]|uniref:SpoIIE family protein phosphatase n=1 Tax=unclassified Streptomyces TaxID=2593676 RepID=UPI004042E2D3
MADTEPVTGRQHVDGPVINGADLAKVLHSAVREAMHRLHAATAAVYLLDEHYGELRLALAGGSPPSLFTFAGKMRLDAPRATARAVQSGTTAVLIDPNPSGPDQEHVQPYPYAALSAPVIAGDQRFGALTVLRAEDCGAFSAAERGQLEEVGNDLARDLAALVEDGVTVAAGPMPMLIPPEADIDTSACTPGWGVQGVPGSGGTSMMYPLRRLADLLNRATAVEDIVTAAEYCVMTPLRAQALVLASVAEGRLWVLGHCGASSDLVRGLHGLRMNDRTPATEAFRGRPLFVSEGPSPLGDGREGQPHTEVYIPLTGDDQLIDVPVARQRHVVGVCCLTFDAPRGFPPEERALLGMMAGLLGSAVDRVELSARQRAVAECLQRTLLPPVLPDLPRLLTTARYLPATVTSKVGGDWYDVITLADDRAVLIVGDVEGHAMESAALMGQVRTATASYATEGHRPAAVIERTGRLLQRLRTDLTVTCCVVSLDTVDGTAEVALAGHPPPLVRGPDGKIGVLEAPANVPLGVCPAGAYQGREHTLESGALLMLYTNGLVGWDTADAEARGRALLGSQDQGSPVDLERLADAVISEVSAPWQRRDDAVLLLALHEGTRGPEEPRVGSLHIQRHDLRGVREARTFVHDRLASWGLDTMSEAMELIVSETVTNALVHAGSDVDVRLRAFTDHIRLEVRDSDTHPPVPSPLSLAEETNAEAEHGRGLLIVEALAEMWNSSPNGLGKTVSLNLPITPD